MIATNEVTIHAGDPDPLKLGVGQHDMPNGGGPCSCGAWHTRRMDIPGICDDALDAALRNACGYLADVRAGRRVSHELLSLSNALLAVYAELEGRVRR